MTKRLWDAGSAGSLDLKVDVNNLFDKQYSFLGRVPDDAYAYPGRNLFATLIYQF
jgi:outer membrane receptor protein involved in Fe transport